MKQIPTEQTEANIRDVLRLLAEIPTRLESSSKGLTEEQLREPLGEGERSFTEVLAHLLNVEARTTEAIQLSLLVNEPELVTVHAERQFGKLVRFDAFPFGELLVYFKLRRMVLMRMLFQLKEGQWARTSREGGKKRAESVYWKVRALVSHELEHVNELEEKVMKTSKTSAATMDEFIANSSKEVRTILEKIRKVIRKAAPGADETINYGIPTFTLKGNLVHFSGFKSHIGFYPTPSGIEKFKKELSPYETAKGSVKFPLDQPIPYDLIEKIAKFRVKENLGKAEGRKKKK